MGRLQECFGVSERRACRLAGQHRSTQRKAPPAPRPVDERLAGRLREIAGEHPRWGWKTAHEILLREGWTLNRKRTRRIWREEGLIRPQKARKRRRLPGGQKQRLRATWAMRCGLLISSSMRRLTVAGSSSETSLMSTPARLSRSASHAPAPPTTSWRSSTGSSANVAHRRI